MCVGSQSVCKQAEQRDAFSEGCVYVYGLMGSTASKAHVKSSKAPPQRRKKKRKKVCVCFMCFPVCVCVGVSACLFLQLSAAPLSQSCQAASCSPPR